MNKAKNRRLLPDTIREVADNEIKRKQSEVAYDIRDFTVAHIVNQFHENFFYIPDYQREFIWRPKHRSEFIESMILGLPIPMMFVADMQDGRLEIVDGAQRIQTLELFLSDELKLNGLRELKTLNGFRFLDLPVAQQRKLSTRALRIVVLDDTTTPQLRHELFERINTRGVKAKSSEIRRGAYAGKFMEFIDECAQNSLFTKLCPVSEPLRQRREPQELVLRFFVYSDEYKKFKHDVEVFLNDYVERHQHAFDRSSMEHEFVRMLKFVSEYFPHGFAKAAGAASTPRVRFEAIAVGVNLALREQPNLVPGSTDWLESEAFALHTTTHASNSASRLAGRVEYVRDQLLANGRGRNAKRR